MNLRTVKDIKNLKNKKVLLRVDFNVPQKNGMIKEYFRIKMGLPTIKFLLANGTSIIILNHLGRPEGKFDKELSNQPIASKLGKLLNKKVLLLNGIVGKEISLAIKKLNSGQVVMLENIRFDRREESNNKTLAKILSNYADIYVNDAFAVCHRKAVSTVAITNYLPAYAGLLLEKEIKNLSQVLESKVKPKAAIIGGAKIETKVKVIKNLLNRIDYVMLGGAIANNALQAMNFEVGLSLVDKAQLKVSKAIINNKLRVPLDVVVAKSRKQNSPSKIKAVAKVAKDDIILDIGPETVKLYSAIIKTTKLVIWNGPMGYFEVAKYKKSSENIAKNIIKTKTFSIIGGGETVEMINSLGLNNKFGFVSTGGGAMLEFLEGKMLPGIKPLVK